MASNPDRQPEDLPPSDLERVREILVGPERASLDALEARLGDLDNPETRVRQIAQALPEAFRLQNELEPDELAQSLVPPTERSIAESAKANPQPLSDALYPIIGPAIRKAIAASISGLVDRINRTLDQTLSWRSLTWRFEAFRRGVPFAQVVVEKSLLYSVEQILVVHRETGLLLLHVHSNEIEAQDADLVASMLTAIQDFVRDSFRVGEDSELRTVQIGEKEVWIERGPQAVAAAVVQGTVTDDFANDLAAQVERFHAKFQGPLRNFEGDDSDFLPAHPAFEKLLGTEYKQQEERSPLPLILGWSVALVVCLALGVHFYRKQARWNQFLEALEATPGILVTEVEDWKSPPRISGLKDPLSPNPRDLLENHGYPLEAASFDFLPYQSLEGDLPLRRLETILAGFPGVDSRIDAGKVQVQGEVPGATKALLRTLVQSFDLDGFYLDSELKILDSEAPLQVLARADQGIRAELQEIRKSLHRPEPPKHPHFEALVGWVQTASELPGLDQLAVEKLPQDRYRVHGKQDPDGTQLRELLQDLPTWRSQIELDLAPYLSDHPKVVEARALRILGLSDPSQVRFQDPDLIVSQGISLQTRQELRSSPPEIPGVGALRVRFTTEELRGWIEGLLEGLDGFALNFSDDSGLELSQPERLKMLQSRMQELGGLLEQLPYRFELRLEGRAQGSDSLGASRRRARWLYQNLPAPSERPYRIVYAGLGNREGPKFAHQSVATTSNSVVVRLRRFSQPTGTEPEGP